MPILGCDICLVQDGRHLLVFGGGSVEIGNFHSNIAVLDTQTWRWTTPPIQVVPSGMRYYLNCRELKLGLAWHLSPQ